MLHEKQDREDPCSSEKLQFTVKKKSVRNNLQEENKR